MEPNINLSIVHFCRFLSVTLKQWNLLTSHVHSSYLILFAGGIQQRRQTKKRKVVDRRASKGRKIR